MISALLFLLCAAPQQASAAGPPAPQKVEVSANGMWAAGLTPGGGVRLWALKGLEAPRELPRDPQHPVQVLAFSPDGMLLLTGHQGGLIRTWTLRTATLARELPAAADLTRIESIVVLPPEGLIVIVGGPDRALRRIELSTGRELLRSNPAELSLDASLWASRDGRLLASRDPEKKLVLLDARTFERRKSPEIRINDDAALAFSPDGKLLCTTTLDGKVLVVELPDGRTAPLAAGQAAEIRSLAFDERGEQILTLGRDGRVRRYDVRSLKEIAGESVTTATPGDPQGVLLLSPNATTIASFNDGQLVSQTAVHFKAALTPSGPEKFVRVPLFFGTNREPRAVDGSVVWHALRFLITVNGFKFLGAITALLGIAGFVSWSFRHLWSQATISARQAVLLVVLGSVTTVLLWLFCTRILSFQNLPETLFSLGILSGLPLSILVLHRCGDRVGMRLVTLLGMELFLLSAGAILSGVMHVRTESSVPGRHFSGENAKQLLTGTCEVTVPLVGHRVGMIDRPEMIGVQFELPDPDRHMIVSNAQIEDLPSLMIRMRDRVAKASKKEAFVFVHGYNVTFEDAALRTAQIAHDLDYPGVPMMFSWPSQGTVAGYPWDEDAVEAAIPYFQQFLKAVSLESGAESIHLIAHSMGNRLLTRVLKELPLDPDAERIRKPFREVVLAAPDINANVFETQYAGFLVKSYPHVTLYANSNDRALTASRAFNNSRRAGDSTDDQICVFQNLDSIDVSALDTNMDGHGYFGTNHVVLSDMYSLLKEGKPAGERFRMAPRTRNGLTYFLFSQ